jgi:hypothetical protein
MVPTSSIHTMNGRKFVYPRRRWSLSSSSSSVSSLCSSHNSNHNNIVSSSEDLKLQSHLGKRRYQRRGSRCPSMLVRQLPHTASMMDGDDDDDSAEESTTAIVANAKQVAHMVLLQHKSCYGFPQQQQQHHRRRRLLSKASPSDVSTLTPPFTCAKTSSSLKVLHAAPFEETFTVERKPKTAAIEVVVGEKKQGHDDADASSSYASMEEEEQEGTTASASSSSDRCRCSRHDTDRKALAFLTRALRLASVQSPSTPTLPHQS